MSHRNFGIPVLFEVEERRRQWRRDFWNFVAVVVIGVAIMYCGVVASGAVLKP